MLLWCDDHIILGVMATLFHTYPYQKTICHTRMGFDLITRQLMMGVSLNGGTPKTPQNDHV